MMDEMHHMEIMIDDGDTNPYALPDEMAVNTAPGVAVDSYGPIVD
jgi:hypothetical protein